MNPPDLPDCVAEISHGIENWLRRKLCKGSEGHLLLNVVEGSSISWGPRGTPALTESTVSFPWVYNDKAMSTYGSQPLIRHGVALAPSVPHLDRNLIHDDTREMPMALKELIAWKGRYTEYIFNDPKATFNFRKNSTHTIGTWV